MENKHFLLKLSLVFAASYWLFESVIHYFLFGEFEFEMLPSDINELWMRTTIIALMITFGFFADYHVNKIHNKDVEKHGVYRAMLSATNHILNNFLNNMILFRAEAEKSKDFDRKLLKLYDQVIIDTTDQINSLDNIQEVNKDVITKTFKPKR